MDTRDATDEEIALRVQEGDTQIFGTLVDRYEQKLKRYGKRFLSQHEDIEDAVQDVFMSAYRNIQGFDLSLRFSPWIYRIAHNSFVNTLRKNDRNPLALDFDTLVSFGSHTDSVETESEQREMRALIEHGLGSLPPKYREILILHYTEDLPYKDIADILQIPMGTVSVRIKRAKEALRKTLEGKL